MKSLKGLLINHFYILGKNSVLVFSGWILMTVILILLHTFLHRLSLPDEVLMVIELLVMPMLLIVVLGLPALHSLENTGYAINARWDVFQKSIPVDKGFIVISYYLLYFLLSVVTVVVWWLSPFDNTPAFTSVILIIQLTCIIYYPLSYLRFLRSSSLEPSTSGNFLHLLAITIAGIVVIPFQIFIPNQYMILIAVILCLYATSILLSIILDNMSRKGYKQNR